jgi:hypothetical protein
MTPQFKLRSSLTAILFFTFLISPMQSSEAGFTKKIHSFSTHLQAGAEGIDIPVKDLVPMVPVKDKKESGKEKSGHDTQKSRHHSDEEKHKNHFHDFENLRCRKKLHAILLGFCFKIIMVVSYFSILLCGYMSIGH